MLNVKTEVRASTIHGLGLFAVERILEGAVIWKYSPKFDVFFTDAELEDVPDFTRAWVHKYAYRNKTTGLWCLEIDDAHFLNHSAHPNTVEIDDGGQGLTVAARTIEAGEEITVDYYVFDADARRKVGHVDLR